MERIIESIRTEVSNEAADEVLGFCGEMPLNASPQEQGRWIKKLVDHMDCLLDEEIRARVMGDCGRQCISAKVVSDAVDAYAASQSIDEFLSKLNEMQMNGGNLKRDGDTILVRYEKCYCGIVNQIEEPMSLTYCNCSRGWNKVFFESVLQKKVEVKLVESVIHGASQCLFEVRIDGC